MVSCERKRGKLVTFLWGQKDARGRVGSVEIHSKSSPGGGDDARHHGGIRGERRGSKFGRLTWLNGSKLRRRRRRGGSEWAAQEVISRKIPGRPMKGRMLFGPIQYQPRVSTMKIPDTRGWW